MCLTETAMWALALVAEKVIKIRHTVRMVIITSVWIVKEQDVARSANKRMIEIIIG